MSRATSAIRRSWLQRMCRDGMSCAKPTSVCHWQGSTHSSRFRIDQGSLNLYCMASKAFPMSPFTGELRNVLDIGPGKLNGSQSRSYPGPSGKATQVLVSIEDSEHSKARVFAATCRWCQVMWPALPVLASCCSVRFCRSSACTWLTLSWQFLNS